MAEVQFLNGPFLVDDPLIGPIREVTDGAPERFTFEEAMGKIGNWQTKALLRTEQSRVIKEHLRLHGTRR